MAFQVGLKRFLFLVLTLQTLSNATFLSSLVSSSVQQNFEPKKNATITLVYKNTGTDYWDPSIVYLRPSLFGYARTWGNSADYIHIPAKILPGNTVTFKFTVTGPATIGDYDMKWKLYSTQLGLFGAEYSSRKTVQFLPAQFIAKLYSEGLGRIPDQTGWADNLSYFTNYGCNLDNLKIVAKKIFSSTEFNTLGLDNDGKIIAVYRSLLARDPDQSGFSFWQTYLSNNSVSAFVDAVLNTPEFSADLPYFFNEGSYGWFQNVIPDYAPGLDHNPTDPNCTYTFGGGSEAALQNVLYGARATQKVCLAQKEIVQIYQTLIIPDGVTLATVGYSALGVSQYPQFGRLIRLYTTTRGWPMVQLGSNARIENIWIDGQESVVGRVNTHDLGIDLQTASNGVTIQESKISDTPAGSGLVIGFNATNISILSNIFTCYTSRHYVPGIDMTWTDGITNGGSSSVITGNYVIDATDVPIVLFGVPGKIQTSHIYNNMVLNAGNSAYGGLAVEQGDAG